MSSRVSDVMTRDVVSLRGHAEFKEIVQTMRRRRISGCPVLDDQDNVVGVVSEDDLLVKEAFLGAEAHGALFHRADRAKSAALTAADLMTRPAITIRPEAAVAEAARRMHVKHVRRLPVVSGEGKLVGVVSRIDLLGLYDRPDDEIRTEILRDVIGAGFQLDSLAFEVTVQEGVVTLSGLVDREPLAHSLLLAVREVDGVVAVRDQLSHPRYEGRERSAGRRA